MVNETDPGQPFLWVTSFVGGKSSAIVRNLDTRRYCRNSSDRVPFEKPRARIFRSDGRTHRAPKALCAKTKPTAEF
jgi:hypothetical protein